MEIYLNPSEKLSGLNLKRGLASLFQYKNVDGEFQERDASGLCNVSYNLIRARFIKKQKIICQQNVYAQEKKHLIPIMGVAVTSSRMSMYELTQAFLPKSIIDYENHTINLRGKQNVGTIITSQRTLTLLPGTLDTSPVQTDTVKDAIALLEQSFRKIPIELQPEPVLCPHSGCITLEEILEQNREALEDAAMGSVKSASALLKLIPLVRDASPEELDKLLKSPRNTKFKSQLYDILGSAGTSVSHQTAMKILEQEKISDDIERYLRALSISTNPNTDIIKDILRRSKETMQNTKISETLALTAAAMARQGGSPTIRERVRGSLEIQLELYRGGLGSFASSFKDNSDTPDEDEAVIAGMDISILGVDIRPFVLFSSQRELIGHIWSGTASKRTPVLQGLLNFPQHKQFIPMSSGFVIETEVNGAASLDLAGQVQLSLWSRKAQSLTNIRSGIAIIGSSRVHSNFIQSSVEFTLSMEPKLELTTDAQYSASVFLCMRLSQPKTTIRHNIYKIERIPGSKHKLRKTRRTELLLPAKSYFLDMKNNEMCSKLIQHN
ncbi:microsomal triglyceride transfer protein isoform X2 [Cephus cinctus]|uniref:Microsomal triglyceride transfer protein isoform X2 n=1 Tax=Cephus cinctus TaxID=211228 RepID=A0AAJ7RSC7_CEPCN|nr:microsomal triglyceride transfer protein isoform X2 [Cephus cinctus]